MASINDSTFTEFRERYNDLDKKRNIATPWKCGSNIDPEHAGIFKGQQGHSFRVTFKRDTSEYLLWGSKSTVNLSSEEGADHQQYIEGMGKSGLYLLHVSEPLKDDGSNKDAIFKIISDEMKSFDPHIRDRAEHYRYVGVSFDTPKPMNSDVQGVHYGEGVSALFNVRGYDVHTVDQTTGVSRKHLSTYRFNDKHGDHFKPVRFRHNCLADGISKISTSVFKGGDYLDAWAKTDQARRRNSQAVWEQQDLYANEGTSFYVQSKLPRLINYLHNRAGALMPQAMVVAGTYAVKPDYGWGMAALFTGLHVVMHGAAEETTEELKVMAQRIGRRIPWVRDQAFVEEDPQKKYLEGYDKLLFKRHNLYKMTPHVNSEVCRKEENICIGAEDIAKLNKFMCAKIVDDIPDDSVARFLLKMHQKNLPGKEYAIYGSPDEFTVGFECDNSISGVFHCAENGDMTIYAFVNSALNKNRLLLAPEEYRDQLKDVYGRLGGRGIVRFTAKNAPDGDIEITDVRENITPMNAAIEVSQNCIPHENEWVRKRSQRTVFELFMPELSVREALDYLVDDEANQDRRRSGVITLPFSEAIMSQGRRFTEFDALVNIADDADIDPLVNA